MWSTLLLLKVHSIPKPELRFPSLPLPLPSSFVLLSHLLSYYTPGLTPLRTVHASVPSNTFAIYGAGEDKELTELVPGILNQLGPDSLASLRKLAESYQSLQKKDGGEGGKAEDEDDDDIPELVEGENFESKVEWAGLWRTWEDMRKDQIQQEQNKPNCLQDSPEDRSKWYLPKARHLPIVSWVRAGAWFSLNDALAVNFMTLCQRSTCFSHGIAPYVSETAFSKTHPRSLCSSKTMWYLAIRGVYERDWTLLSLSRLEWKEALLEQ